MNGGENIVKWIKGQRISSLRHLERMEEDRMSKKIFTQELEGTRCRGRPRKRWKEEAERDLQVPGVRRWRELVTDRKKWRNIVQQAKARSGLECQWRREEETGKLQFCISVGTIYNGTKSRKHFSYRHLARTVYKGSKITHTHARTHTHKNEVRQCIIAVLPHIQHHKHINTYINKYEQHGWWH
jgi:hypothetical protein